MKYMSIFFFLFSITFLRAQMGPICDSPANGSDWRLIGPDQMPELGPKAYPQMVGTGAQIRLQFLDADRADPKILYAGTPTGGLFRTMDATAEMPVWENLTDSTRLPVLGVRGFGLVPNKGGPPTIFIGTGIRYPLDMRRRYGIGVLRSPNGGRDWERTGLEFSPPGGGNKQTCHDVLVDAENPLVIHALCGPDYYRSDDGGQNFALKKELDRPCPAGWGKSFRDIVAKPGRPKTLYLSTDGNFFFRSTDGGDSWAETDVRELGVEGETIRADVAVSPLDPDLVYLACRAGKKEVLLRSLDAGLTWEIVFQKNIRTSFERNAVAISPHDVNVIYFGGLYIDQVVLGGEKPKVKRISSGLHLDHRDLIAVSDGAGTDILYSANDGGLYRGFFTGGKKGKWEWRDISGTGMNNTQFYGIAVAEDFSVVLGGTQDNGMLVGDREGHFFKPRIGGDAVDAAVDRYDTDLLYGTSWALQPPSVHRSTDAGLTFGRALGKGFTGRADTYYFPLETHEDGCLYAGKEQVYRLPPGSDEWEQIGDIDLPTNLPFKVTAMCVAPSDPDYIYAYGDKVYRTVNATADSAVWTDVSKGLGRAIIHEKGGGTISAVEVHPDDPRKVWVGFRVYGSPRKVYYSGDAGLTWTRLSEVGLPNWPVNALAVQGGTKGAVYAGTDVGVFYNPDATDPSSEWRCFNRGLPVSFVIDLEMNYCTGTIIAGTHGRGIWESPFAGPSVFPTEEVAYDAKWERCIFRSDLVVKRGSALTLAGEVRMATGAKIIVERNAKLILDGARVKSLCGTTWGGIVPEDGLNFFQRLFGGRPGKVELKNGAVLEQVRSEK